MRLEIRRVGQIKDGEEVCGCRTRVKVVKNKLAPPFRQAEFDILFNRGISAAGDLLDLGLQHKLIARSGSWFSRGETRLGQGREAARTFLEENPDIAAAVAEEIGKLAGLAPGDSDPEPHDN